METVQQQPPSARDRILNTALKLFYQNGVRATGIDRIIAESGVAKMSFYRNFPSKADLVAAFLHKRHDNWMGWFTSSVERKIAQPNASLSVIADVLQSWFEDPGFRGCAFINTFAEGGPIDSEPNNIAREHKQQLKEFVEKIADRLGLNNPKTVADAAILVIEGAIVRAQMTGNPAEAQTARLLFQCIEHA